MINSSSTDSSPQTVVHMSDIGPDCNFDENKTDLSQKRSLDLCQSLDLDIEKISPIKKKKINLKNAINRRTPDLIKQACEFDFDAPLEIVQIQPNSPEGDDANISEQPVTSPVPVNLPLQRGRGRPRKKPISIVPKDDAKKYCPTFPRNLLKALKKLPVPKFETFSFLKQMETSRQIPGYYYYRPSFHRPEGHYLRQNESFSEQKYSVEYDLDLEDKSWVEYFYQVPSLDELSDEVPKAFEYIIDCLEKEWFDMTRKNELSAQASRGPQNNLDAPCDICRETDCENSNAIVFCDGCDLAVHQDCYGIPYIPEGQWLCRKCMLSPENPVECLLCPNEGGAFKQTSSSSWAHLNCALWIPEITFGNSVYMEPVEGIGRIPKSRKKLICYLCKKQHGACIQCFHKSCIFPFHVTCAKAAQLCMRYKVSDENVDMRAFCHKHTPKYYKKEINIDVFDSKSKKDPTELLSPRRKHSVSKSARAHNHSFNTSKPVIPEELYEKVLRGMAKFKIPKPKRFLNEVCKYWSLKKENCRGAPLIKRLHIEPWTVAPQILQTEEEKLATYGSLKSVRSGLEKTRMLLELVRKRESAKLNILRVQQEYWESHFFPHVRILREILSQMIKLDIHEYFTEPVSKEQAPDYYDFVKSPMDLKTLTQMINEYEVYTLESFKEKLLLVYDNCLFYNEVFTCYYKTANRHKKRALELLELASARAEKLKIDANLGMLSEPFNTLDFFADCYSSQLCFEIEKGLISPIGVNYQSTADVTKKSIASDEPPKENVSNTKQTTSNTRDSKRVTLTSIAPRPPLTRSQSRYFDSYNLRRHSQSKSSVAQKKKQLRRNAVSFKLNDRKKIRQKAGPGRSKLR